MRRATALLLVALGTASVAGAEERRSVGDFQSRAEIEIAPGAGEAYGVPLSAEASAALKEGREVRVFDARGREIPSLVHSAYARPEIRERPVSVFNQAWNPGLVQTLAVELTDRGPQSVNEFTFEIRDEQYNASVRVEGSDESSGGSDDWRIAGDGLHLIRHTIPGEKIDYVHNVLRIPTSRYRRYRFTLRQPGREEPLTIESVSVREVIHRGTHLTLPVHLEGWKNPRDPDKRHQYWRLGLDRAYLGVNRVDLTIFGTDYARPAKLWAWNPELSRPGDFLDSTVLFQYGNDRDTGFGGFTSDAEELVMMIDQGDDEPIPVARVRASRPRQQVRFLMGASAEAPLALYFTPDVPRDPEYDLPRRLEERGIAAFASAEHGPLTENPAYRLPPEPLSERAPQLLYAVVGALVLGLGIYLARTLRKGLPPEEPS